MAYNTPGIYALDTVDGLVREMRPWQWYKQLVLLLGIVLSKSASLWSCTATQVES